MAGETYMLRFSSHAIWQEDEVETMKVLFDFYDRDRDGMLTVEEASLLCT